ncbi:MAG: acetoacetate decarboxylase [Lachnospiraceae bacterium]|nr:acetoacetate decarboxylase [Lachnospiraceae bacterium]
MWKYDPKKIYHMPVFFGGTEFVPGMTSNVYDNVTINMTLACEARKLKEYIPEEFELMSPSVILTFCQLRAVEFMAGGGYNLIQIGVPVRYEGKENKLDGLFPLIIWENNAIPILGGREESGQPKVFADIQDLHSYENRVFTNASYEGNKFLELEMKDMVPISQSKLDKMNEESKQLNIFGYRCIPKVGEPGLELRQPILYPQQAYADYGWSGKGVVDLYKLTAEQCPPYYHVVDQLKELPLKEPEQVIMTQGNSKMMPFAGKVLS